MGPQGVRRTKELHNNRFTWPGMGVDVTEFVHSCDVCLRLNKAGNRQAHMAERPVISEPFESVAVDLVGPLPKAKGGVKYVLTFVCLATRWPEAVPLRTESTSEVADGLISVITRTNIPLKMLSDRGSVFMTKVVKRLCEILGISKGNGVIERLHATLKPMLAKARDEGIDWAMFLPMALFAIRQLINRDTGFSPHELSLAER